MEAKDYVLDTDVECDRLERQGLLHGRDRVLEQVDLAAGTPFSDAGSGSGWVARTIASTFPNTQVVGTDINPRHVECARRLLTPKAKAATLNGSLKDANAQQ